MLIEVARRLRTSVRQKDMIGRLGGDEFMVMLALRHDMDVGQA